MPKTEITNTPEHTTLIEELHFHGEKAAKVMERLRQIRGEVLSAIDTGEQTLAAIAQNAPRPAAGVNTIRPR